MLALTSAGLQALTAVAAVVSIVAVAVFVTLRADTTGTSLARRLLTRTAPVVVLAVAAQGMAVLTVALAVNQSYGFYTSWADLLGRASSGAAIKTGGLLSSPDEGKVQVITVHAHVGGRNDRLLVWTPRQYDEPAYQNRRFPVVEFLPGQPNSADAAFRHFDFGRIASGLVNSGKVPPFVAVFPTLMIAPPRDTECTDVPGGPQAETWLERDVPAFMTSHYRVLGQGRGWSMLGWSTGGFCAAKLLFTHPNRYGSAASFGGYYSPIQDHTTGNLFGGRKSLEELNSPMTLYRRLQTFGGGLQGARFLVVAGRQDNETWPETSSLLDLTAHDSGVSHLIFPQGGHNYGNYRRYLPDVLTWSAAGWPR